MSGARHEQAVQMLTGLERFVRLVVEREMLLPRDTMPPTFSSSPSPSPGPEKSPRMFGLPKPYTSLYTAGSYMANRPGYAGYKRSPGDPAEVRSPQSNLTSPSQAVAEPSVTQSPDREDTVLPPQPAPRKLFNGSTSGVNTTKENHPQQQQQQQQPHEPLTHTNSASSDGDEAQVLPKPITNEEFQAMIDQ